MVFRTIVNTYYLYISQSLRNNTINALIDITFNVIARNNNTDFYISAHITKPHNPLFCLKLLNVC